MPNVSRSLATLLLAAAACGPMRRGTAVPPAIVVFTNESTDLADVYAVSSSGATARIGSVTAGRTESLRIPVTVLGGTGVVNVVARILASSRRPSSGQITLRPGDKIAITLPSTQNILTVLPVREP
jgi:hypothetical protein